MSFKVINEKFDCQNCNAKVEKLPGSCRNHCNNCLYSRHLDKDSPGDRKSDCQGLMKPVLSFQNKKKGWMIMHKCIKCHKEIPNKIAEDDNFDLVVELAKPYNE